MKTKRSRAVGTILSCACCAGGAGAQPAATVPEETPPAPALKVGIDYYIGDGWSNRVDIPRFRDGYWTGFGTSFPSNIYANWQDAAGGTGKVAQSVGKMYRDSPTLKQPVEAWYRRPVGASGVLAGKFYVPFALQEWEWETRWGLQIEGERGPNSVVAAMSYNDIVHDPNLYLRLGRRFGSDWSAGISAAAGRGLSFGSAHDRGAGLDATFSRRGWRLQGEVLRLQRRSSGRFDFAFAKLSYEGWSRVTPYVSRHTFTDATEFLGRFHGTTLGLNVQVWNFLALEAAYVPGSTNGDVRWIQAHVTVER